ncbi:hypothetical protein BDF14DRAFT_1960154 [Spinellus fusiger]|nr:hypothetical protein BDF14DRAFT_1960154 [Spinellus fusiger]
MTQLPPISMIRTPEQVQAPFISSSSSQRETVSRTTLILPKPHCDYSYSSSQRTPPPPPITPPTSNPYSSLSYSHAPSHKTPWMSWESTPLSHSEPTDTSRHPSTESSSSFVYGHDKKHLTSSDDLLAEKRRRNAGASARFRDRRKQRERELQEKYNALEIHTKALASALQQYQPDHALLKGNPLLSDRVSQLERIMTQFRQDKAEDTYKLDELEKENTYLRSLLVPVRSRPYTTAHTTVSDGIAPPHSVFSHLPPTDHTRDVLKEYTNKRIYHSPTSENEV